MVIDACVARAAGGTEAESPVATNCRDFLLQVSEICHRMVLSSELYQEWDKHATKSKFSRKWWLKMERMGKVDQPPIQPDLSLRKRFLKFSRSEGESYQIKKDIPLIEAARATDRLIASWDDTARRRFARLSAGISELRNLTWVNPARFSEDNLRQWLQAGAPNEQDRELGQG